MEFIIFVLIKSKFIHVIGPIMFFIIIMFMLLTLHLGNKTYMYKGMGNTNDMLTKSVLIHTLERILKRFQIFQLIAHNNLL